MTDPSKPAQPIPEQADDPNTNAPNPANTDLPEGFSPWEGSSMAVRQGKHWSSTLIWLSAVLFGGALLWAFTAKVDQTITVRGQLSPTGSVEEVDAPATGVVSRVYVKDGQEVLAGTPLVAIESEGLLSRRTAVETTIRILRAENESLQGIISSGGNASALPPVVQLPADVDLELKQKLSAAIEQTQQIRARLVQIEARIDSKTETLRLTQKIEADLLPLYKNGGFSRIQYLTQRNKVQEQKSELSSLREEKVSTLGTVSGKINSNNRDLERLQSELAKLQEDLSYRVIKAPISGTVFDLKVTPSSSSLRSGPSDIT